MRDASQPSVRLRARERKRRQRLRDREKTFREIDLLLDAPTRILLRELAEISARPEKHCAQQLLRQHLPDTLKTWRKVSDLCRETAAALALDPTCLKALSIPGAKVPIGGKIYTYEAVREALERRAKLDAWMAAQGVPPLARKRLLGLSVKTPHKAEAQ